MTGIEIEAYTIIETIMPILFAIIILGVCVYLVFSLLSFIVKKKEEKTEEETEKIKRKKFKW